MRSLAELKKGQKAIVRSFTNHNLCAKLIEMGCLPGEEIMLSQTAPLGCPLAITISGYQLSLRRDEASSVIIELVA
jgi:ferrous iron transport protein A